MYQNEISYIKLKSIGKENPNLSHHAAIIIARQSAMYQNEISYIKLKSKGKGNPNLSHHAAIIIACQSAMYQNEISYIKLKSKGKGNQNLSHHAAIIIACQSAMCHGIRDVPIEFSLNAQMLTTLTVFVQSSPNENTLEVVN